MSLERELKEAFERHAGDADPSPAAWSGIERRIAWRRRVRAGLTGLATAALIAAIVVAVPRLAPDEEPGNIATGGPSPTDSPSPTASASPGPIDTAGWVARAGVAGSFSLKIPPDWKGGWFEGSWDFEPEDLPSLPEGGDVFAVQVTPEEGSYDDPDAFGFATGELEAAEVNGRAAFRAEAPQRPVGSHRLVIVIDWPACPGGATPCRLKVMLFGTTGDLWTEHRETGEQVVRTLDYYDGSKPVHGKVHEGIAVDDLTKGLVRFLDARVEGLGAEAFLTENAANQYQARGEDSLYSAEGARFTDWSIDVRNEADAGSAEFEISLGLDPPADEIRETVGVGPGRSVEGESVPAVVRFSEPLE